MLCARFEARKQGEKRGGVAESRKTLEERMQQAGTRRTLQRDSLVEKAQRHVANAAQVAREHRAKRSEQGIFLRKNMEERLEMAAKKRRERLAAVTTRLVEYLNVVDQRRGRVRSTRFVQKWFRQLRTSRKAVVCLRENHADLAGLVHLVDAVERGTIEEAMELLTRDNATKMAQKILGIVPKSEELKLRPKRFRTSRVFLMSAMIAFHPKDILDGSQDIVANFLYHASHLMVREIRRMFQELSVDASSAATKVLRHRLKRFDAIRTLYIDAFGAWKMVDGEKLAGELIQTYAEMFTTNYVTTLDYADAGEEDRIHEIVAETRVHLAQLRRAIEKAIGKDTSDERLRFIENKVKEEVVKKQADRQKKLLEERQLQEERKVRLARKEQSAASKPDLDFTRNVFSNDVLAHELILNPMYQIEKPQQLGNHPGLDLYQRVEQQMKRAFWDSMMASLTSTQPNYAPLLARLNEMRDLLLSVLGSSTREYDDVAQRLHASVLEETVTTLPFSWPSVQQIFSFVLSKILATEAPARNESTTSMMHRLEQLSLMSSTSSFSPQEKKKPSDLTDASQHFEGVALLPEVFSFVYAKVDEIRLDSINAHLRILAPYLQRHGVEHEAKKFNARWEKGDVSLDKTTQWINKQMLGYFATDRAGLLASTPTSFRSFLRECFLSLIEIYVDESRSDSIWPETFAMDVERIQSLRNDVDAIALKASLLALLRQTLHQSSVVYTDSQAALLLKQLGSLLQDPTLKVPDLQAHLIEETKRVLKESKGMDMNAAAVESMQSHLASVFDAKNPVFKLFFTRCMKGLGLHLASSEWNEARTCASGLQMFASEMHSICLRAQKLCDHNEKVHASHYNRLIREACEAQEYQQMD